MRNIQTSMVVALVGLLVLTSCQTIQPPQDNVARAANARQWKGEWLIPTMKSYTIDIGENGFTDPRHLNVRNPPEIVEEPRGKERLVFTNRTVGHRISISVPIEPAVSSEDLAGGGFVLDRAACTRNCTATATLEPGAQAVIGTKYVVPNMVMFRVLFADEPDPPSNSLGYLWITRETTPSVPPSSRTEPPAPVQPVQPPLLAPAAVSAAAVPSAPGAAAATPDREAPPNVFTILGGINGQIEPKLDLSNEADATKPLTLAPGHPYDGGQRRFFKGTAALDTRVHVQDWGFAEATVTFKDGEYARDSTLNVSASKYRIVLQSPNGMQLAFGKIAFASPSSKIALNEAGEGAQLEIGPRLGLQSALNVSVIVKRQRHPDATAKPVHDDMAVLLQNTEVPINLWIFNKVGFYALLGRDENKDDEHSYSTAGGEFAFNKKVRRGAVVGASSLYISRRGQGRFDDGTQGGVFFTNIAFSPESPHKDKWTALLGTGSADDASTTRDEGYVGENQGFAPDIIFFNLLTKPLRFGDTPGVGFGLGNKTYVSLQYSTERWSLLRALARLALKENEIRSSSSAFSIHKYNLREDRAAHPGRDAGWEADLKFAVETLPKVKLNLGIAYYKRGDALSDIIKKDIWAITTGVAVEAR